MLLLDTGCSYPLYCSQIYFIDRAAQENQSLFLLYTLCPLSTGTLFFLCREKYFSIVSMGTTFSKGGCPNRRFSSAPTPSPFLWMNSYLNNSCLYRCWDRQFSQEGKKKKERGRRKKGKQNDDKRVHLVTIWKHYLLPPPNYKRKCMFYSFSNHKVSMNILEEYMQSYSSSLSPKI